MPDMLRPSKKKKLMPLFQKEKAISVLGGLEKFAFKLAHRMNQGSWKQLWGFCQRHIGSLWIKLATYNLMTVFGIENVKCSDVRKPLLLVANHRSFFDMYCVSSVIFRQTKRAVKLYFPVRAEFFYDHPMGVLINLVVGFWAMYPPFFRTAKEAEKLEFNKYSLRRLIQICSAGEGHIIGFHPEGKRNLTDNPYEFARAQPGIGKVVMEARPCVVPVFIGGLGNNLPKQIWGNWTSGEKIRVWFGEEIDLSDFYNQRNALRTHKKIADFLMKEIGKLGEKDEYFMKHQSDFS